MTLCASNVTAILKDTLAVRLPKEVEHCYLATLQEKLVKTRAKVVPHRRYITYLLAEIAVMQNLFQKILAAIDDLRRSPGLGREGFLQVGKNRGGVSGSRKKFTK